MDPVGFHHFHKSCFQEHLKVLESKYLQERLTLCSALMGSSLVHADPVTTCQDVTRQTLQFLKVAVPMAGLNEHEGRSEPYPDHKVSLLTVWNLTTTAQLIVVSVPLNAVVRMDAILLVTNLPEHLLVYGWYKGDRVEPKRQIALCVIDRNYPRDCIQWSRDNIP